MEISPGYLKALALTAAGKKDPRHYLVGVLFEVHHSHVIMASTDGHRLTVVMQSIEPGSFTEGSYIVPIEVIKGVKDTAVVFTCGDQPDVTLTQDGVSKTFQPIDGSFPDFRRVIPSRKTSGVAANFNPAHLQDAAKALKHLGNTRDVAAYPYVYHNGPDAAVVDLLDPHAVLVLMPVKPREEDTTTVYLSTFAAAETATRERITPRRTSHGKPTQV